VGPHRRKEPLTLAEAKTLEHWSERVFAVAVCSNPDLLVYHEPGPFTLDGETTVPDFVVVNRKQKRPKRRKMYIEVTRETSLERDRKQKQERVMREISERNPAIGYIQLSRKELQKISAAARRKAEVR
jgi:hypothetical protein